MLPTITNSDAHFWFFLRSYNCPKEVIYRSTIHYCTQKNSRYPTVIVTHSNADLLETIVGWQDFPVTSSTFERSCPCIEKALVQDNLLSSLSSFVPRRL